MNPTNRIAAALAAAFIVLAPISSAHACGCSEGGALSAAIAEGVDSKIAKSAAAAKANVGGPIAKADAISVAKAAVTFAKEATSTLSATPPAAISTMTSIANTLSVVGVVDKGVAKGNPADPTSYARSFGEAALAAAMSMSMKSAAMGAIGGSIGVATEVAVGLAVGIGLAPGVAVAAGAVAAGAVAVGVSLAASAAAASLAKSAFDGYDAIGQAVADL